MPTGELRRAGSNVGLYESMQVASFVARDGGEADAPRQGVEISTAECLGFVGLSGGMVDHLDRSDNEHLAGLERTAEIVGSAERHFGLIDLDNAFQGIAVRIDHGTPQLLFQQPSCAIANSELPSQLSRRHAVGMRGHQVGRLEPDRQRQLGPVHHRSGRYRGMRAALSARVGKGAARQHGSVRAAAFRANETVRPAPLQQQPGAAFLVGKPRLELKKGQRLGNRA